MTPPAAAVAQDAKSRCLWTVATIAGLVAGIGSWLGGELAYGAFKPRLHQYEVFGMVTRQPTVGSENAAEYRNATLAFAILGGVTGLTFGVAGGLASRKTVRGIAVGLAALVVGTIVGAVASLGLLRLLYQGYVRDPNDLISPILVQSGIWAAIAALGGTALAHGLDQGRLAGNAAAGACVGAILATILFHVLSQGFFPDSRFSDPLANSSVVRLMARVLVTLLAALGAAREILRSGRPEEAAPSPSPGPVPAT